MGEERSEVEAGGSRYTIRAEGSAAVLAEGEVIVGRSPYCSLVLDHDAISRVHASFRIAEDGSVQLADLGSCNGTYVNGTRIGAPVKVTRGDDIRIGRVRIWLEVASARALVETGKFSSLTDTDAAGSDRRGKRRS